MANTALPCSSLALTQMRFITKATPISYIDSKCHIKKLKSSRTCLIGYSDFISSRMVFNSLRGKDTHTHTDFPDKSYFKETRHAPGTIGIVQPRLTGDR